MTKYQALPLATNYWTPGTDYLNEIGQAVKGKVRVGDFVVISEKALSTAVGNMIDESTYKTSGTARFLATAWMHIVWGYGLGFLCRFGLRLINRLRQYPVEAGSRHKQVALHEGDPAISCKRCG